MNPPQSKYAHVFNVTPRIVQPSEDIPFDSNGPISHAFIHNYGSSVVIVKASGSYKVTYSVSSDMSNQLVIMVNNNPRYGTLYGIDTGFQNVGQAIITICEGDVLSLRNISAHPIQLSTQYIDVYGLVNASLIIEEV
jgi:hypothetical protein